jgi:hypothetical protein
MAGKVEGEGLFSEFGNGDGERHWIFGVGLVAGRGFGSTMLEWLMQIDEVWWGWTNAGLALWGGFGHQ